MNNPKRGAGRILQKDAPLAIVAPDQASPELIFSGLALLQFRVSRDKETVLISQGVNSEAFSYLPLWHYVTDRLKPLEFNHLLMIGVEQISDTGLFADHPSFSDWPEESMSLVRYDKPYFALTYEILSSVSGLDVRTTTTLLSALVSYMKQTPDLVMKDLMIFRSLMLKGGNYHLVFKHFDLKAPPNALALLLSSLEEQEGLIEGYINKSSLTQFNYDRSDVFESAAWLDQAGFEVDFQLSEASQRFEISIRNPKSAPKPV